MKRAHIRWKDNMLIKILLVVFFVTIPVYCTGGPDSSGGSWLEQWETPRVIMSALFGIIAFFLIRTLNRIDTNQTNLYERMRIAETDLAVVKDRCDAALACIYKRRDGDHG